MVELSFSQGIIIKREIKYNHSLRFISSSLFYKVPFPGIVSFGGKKLTVTYNALDSFHSNILRE